MAWQRLIDNMSINFNFRSFAPGSTGATKATAIEDISYALNVGIAGVNPRQFEIGRPRFTVFNAIPGTGGWLVVRPIFEQIAPNIFNCDLRVSVYNTKQKAQDDIDLKEFNSYKDEESWD